MSGPNNPQEYQTAVLDACGVHIVANQFVAHVARQGSMIRIKRRLVIAVRQNFACPCEVQFADTKRWAFASNCVLVEQP